jgi:hypothetical protein
MRIDGEKYYSYRNLTEKCRNALSKDDDFLRNNGCGNFAETQKCCTFAE